MSIVRFMSYSKWWNCHRTWNLCFLSIFSWKKLGSVRVICILWDLISVQLKIEKNRKIPRSTTISTRRMHMTWTRHNIYSSLITLIFILFSKKLGMRTKRSWTKKWPNFRQCLGMPSTKLSSSTTRVSMKSLGN